MVMPILPEARLGFLRVLALVLLGVLLFLPGQFSMPPIDRDEARYAQATMQMVESGHFVDVRFQDQPRYLQPAGIYWLQALSVEVFAGKGQRKIWVHRVPSLLGAVAALVLTALIGARLFSLGTGLLAGALLASSVLLGFEARLATIDATLLAVILAGEYALSRVYIGRTEWAPRLWPALLFWASVGVGTMLKGPVAPLVLFGTLLGLAVSEGRYYWMARLRPLIGIPLALAIMLPWFVAIGVISGGDFFARSVGHNFLGKVAEGQQAHGLPPGYYLVLATVTFWPGVIVVMRSLPWVWRNRREDRVRFLLSWIVPTWVVFELVATKLPHYVLPTYPALAVLAAAGALSVGGWALAGWQRLAFGAYAAIWLMVGLALAIGLPVLLWWAEGLWSVPIAMLAVAATVAVVACVRAAWAGEPVRAVALGAAAALFVSINAYANVLPALRTVWLSPRVAALVAQTRPCPGSVLASTGYSEPSLVYLVGTDTRLADIATTAAHVERDPACALALVSADQEPAFLALLAQRGIVPRLLGRVDGIDYSNGRRLSLGLYAGR